MNVFDLSPEDLSALALFISIGFARQYTDDDQLGILAVFFTAIGDSLGLIQLQRETLAGRFEKAKETANAKNDEKDVSNESDS